MLLTQEFLRHTWSELKRLNTRSGSYSKVQKLGAKLRQYKKDILETVPEEQAYSVIIAIDHAMKRISDLSEVIIL